MKLIKYLKFVMLRTVLQLKGRKEKKKQVNDKKQTLLINSIAESLNETSSVTTSSI